MAHHEHYKREKGSRREREKRKQNQMCEGINEPETLRRINLMCQNPRTRVLCVIIIIIFIIIVVVLKAPVRSNTRARIPSIYTVLAHQHTRTHERNAQSKTRIFACVFVCASAYVRNPCTCMTESEKENAKAQRERKRKRGETRGRTPPHKGNFLQKEQHDILKQNKTIANLLPQ